MIEIRLDTAPDMAVYASVPIAFEVRELFDAEGLVGRRGRWVMSRATPREPYMKDYDACRDNAPRDWSRRLGASAWTFWGASVDGRRVGSAALAAHGEIGVLWDIRVAPDARRTGAGSALLAAIEQWGPLHGIHWLQVETQNVNVPAYAFYRARGFTLTDVRGGAYPDLPHEVQMILHKRLAGPHGIPDEVMTPRLLLKRRRASQAAEVKSLVDANLEHLRAWMPWAMREPSTLEAMEERLARFDTMFEQGLEWPFGIWSRDGEHLGSFGVHPRLGPPGLELGYWLSKDATGHGYATEAAEAMTRIALTQPGVTHVQIRHDPRNTASEGIPRRLGYRHVLTIEYENAPDGSPRHTKVWQAP